jgi:hypothetical protein
LADSTTPFLGLTNPEIGASADTWGTKENTDRTLVDAAIESIVEKYNYATASGVDTILVTLSPAPLSYVAGLLVRFKTAGANTTGVTLNVNSLGAKTVKYRDGSALAAGALISGVIYTAEYNGTDFIIQGGGTSAASAAETLTGTDATKYLTPAGLAGNKSLAANGYYEFPGGFTIQAGAVSTSVTGESDLSVTFPVAFSTACMGVMAMANNPAGSSGNDGFPQLKSMSTTGATFRMQDVGGTLAGVTWIAVGY